MNENNNWLFYIEVKKIVLCSQVYSDELNKIVTMLIDAKKFFIYLLYYKLLHEKE